MSIRRRIRPSVNLHGPESTPAVSADSSRDAQIQGEEMWTFSDLSAENLSRATRLLFEAPNNLPSNAGDHKGHSSTSASREGSNIVITLTDPGLLDCPICCEPLTVPVFQCDQNGHLACSLCCTKINNKCPFCSCPIGSNRCRAIEKIVESSTTRCKNIKYGCNIPVTYNTKNEHEKTCVCSPCSCPYLGCKFVSSAKELYQHFSNDHLDSAIGFLYDNFDLDYSFPITLTKNDSFLVVREMNSGTLFILHNRIEVLGNVVTVSCIQPSFMEDFNYDLLVSNKESSLKFRSLTKSTPSLQVNGSPSRSFLLIPCEFFNSCGQVKIDVSIRRKW
ncbi:E3 ubiquitin-protein ligase SINA-like 7 [Rosa sericea]